MSLFTVSCVRVPSEPLNVTTSGAGIIGRENVAPTKVINSPAFAVVVDAAASAVGVFDLGSHAGGLLVNVTARVRGL